MKRLFISLLLLVLLISPNAFGTTLADGLVSYWKLNDASGSVAYNTAGGTNGTISGCSWSAGELLFDGTNDYVSFGEPANLNITGNFTYSMWVYSTPPHKEGIAGLYGNRSGTSERIILFNDGSLWCQQVIGGASKQAVAPIGSIPDSTWTLVTVVYDGAELVFYINGVKQTPVAASGAVSNSSGTRQLGWGDVDANYYFLNGKLKKVMIYNRALSVAEINNIYTGMEPTISIVTGIGDSLIAGPTDPTISIMGSVAKYLDGHIYQNKGVASQNTTQISARFATDVTSFLPAFAIIEGGVNDIADGVAKSVYIANMTSMLSACQSNSIIPIVLQILPWTNGTNAQMQTRDDWKASLITLCASYPTAILIDTDSTAGQFRTGGDTGNLWDIKTAFNLDGIHYTESGYDAIAGLIHTQIYNHSGADLGLHRNVIKVEGEQTYQALTPSALTAYKALSFLPSDVLSQSSGSAIGSSLTVNECVDGNQGAICLWYYPYNNGNAGQLRYLYDCYVDANNRISVYISAANNLTLDVIEAGTTRTCSTSLASILPFTWNHIICTWSKNTDVNGTNNSYVYLNGSGAGQTTATIVMASVPSTFSIGSDYAGKNSANGLLAYKIMRQYMTSDQVTADYNSGNGSTEFFTRTPHCICLGLTGDSSTGISYSHRGASVSAITDGATEDTVTTVANSGNRFADNDRVIISAGNGYNSNLIGNTFVDGVPSSTSINVDDGAGGDVGLLEKVGTNLDCNALYYASAANNTVHDITTEDISISAWVKVDSNMAVNNSAIMGKGTIASGHYRLYVANTGYLTLQIGDGDTYYVRSATDLRDNKWHYVAGIIDRDTSLNSKVFIDEVDVSNIRNGTIGNVTNLSNIGTLNAGAIAETWLFDGQIRDVKLYYANNDHWTDAQVLYQATHPLDISASAGTITDNWFCNDGSGTTVTGGVNNLTLSNALAWNQEGFISRNLFVDGDMRQAIGAYPRISGATVTKNTTMPIADEQDLKLVNTGAAQGYAGQSIKTASGEDYYFYGLVKGPTTVNGASVLVNIDADASKSITATQSGLTAATVTETEFCFQAGDTSTDVDLGTGSVTSAEIAYWDNVKVISSLVVNGSCEGAADPPTSWVQETNATVVSDTSSHAGTNCLKVTAGANNVGASQAVTLVSGKYYTVGCYLKATAGDSVGLYVDYGDGVVHTIGTTTATTWTRVRGSFKATGTAGVVYIRAITNTDIVWADDCWIIRDDYAVASIATKGSGVVPSNQPYIIR